MNILHDSKIKDTLKYILPSIITAIIFCTVLLIKGIYPFGIETIDFYDLSDQGTPIYLHIYDAIHGHKNLFYDIYSALTTNMTGMLGTSGISPFNLYFLFIKRESVLKCMSIFILLKMMVMSLGMYIFLEKATKTDYIYKVVFSVCYGFSGFVLLHYTSHIWFDNVAYFPFVMAGLYDLIKKGRYVLYAVSVTLTFICGYYISFLFFIYIFLMLGLYITVNKAADKSVGYSEKRNYHLVELLVCTVLSAAAASFILLPQIIQTLSSARFSNESGGGILGMYMGILSNVTPAYTSRWFNILGVSFAVAIIIVGFIKHIKYERLTIITIGSVFIMCAELLFENINLFWHYGSYVHYPLRNGFMIGFTLSFLACMHMDAMQPDEGVPDSGDTAGKKHFSFAIVAAVFVCICIFLTVVLMYIYSIHPGMSQRSVFHILAAVMEICAVVYVLSALLRNGKYLKLAPVLIVCELIFYGFVFLGEPTYITGYTEEPEMERDSYYICNQIFDSFEFLGECSPANRVKNPDVSLNSNYALVLRRSALSNWTALISPKLQDSARKLGYTVQYTRLIDSGGTIFSDALIGVEDIISCVPQDEELYRLVDSADIIVSQETGETDTYYWYKCKYKLPWGILLRDTDNINFEEDDVVKLYNSIYSSIVLPSGKSADGTIASYIGLSEPESSFDRKQIDQSVSVDGHKALYYFADQVDTDDYNTTISVNGEVIRVPSISEKDNTLYPAHFNNNALYLGTFNNEDVDLSISFSLKDKDGNDVKSQFAPKIVAIDISNMTALCNEYTSYDAHKATYKTKYELAVETENDGYIMLPLSYDEGYRAKVNRHRENIQFLGGLFMAVPVHAGQNSIVIKFMPKGFVPGLLISVISLLISAILIYFLRNKEFKRCAFIEYLYISVWCAAVLFMYIVPVVYSVFITISKIIYKI